MQRCIIIDPCLFRFGGHEYAMNEFLCEQAKESEYEPLVLCNHQFQETASFPYKAIFTYSPYASVGASEKDDRAMFQFGNRDVFAMLKNHISFEDISEGSMILIHSACPTILGGIARWLRLSKRSDLKLRIVMRWGVETRHHNKIIGAKLFQRVCNLISTLSCDTRFFVDSLCLQKHYQEIYDREYTITPIGVDFRHAPKQFSSPSPKESLSFVFSGTPLYSKGGRLLPEAIQMHLLRFPKDSFVLHICGLSPEEEHLFTALPSENITLVRAYKKGTEFFTHLMQGDVALLPYSPQAYKLRTSHILLESLGVGRGVIISPHPWMNQILDQLPESCGVSMKNWDAESLADAMHQFRMKQNSFLMAASIQSQYIRDTHNAKEWWKSIQ